MDSKYNTNSYKMPFFSISTLTNEGHIYILSKAFLSNEKKDTFIWALSFFKSNFRKCRFSNNGWMQRVN